MKYILLFCFSLSLLHSDVKSQVSDRDAKNILLAVQQKLNSLHSVSYHYVRETKYFADNYSGTNAADMYIEFTTASPTGLRFQSSSDTRGFVYNGQVSLRIDRKEMTIDSTVRNTARSMDNNSDLFHSFAMLRNVLPLVIQNDTIRKTVSDTTINGQLYTCITLEAPQTYFGIFNGIEHFTTPNLRRPYCLVIDKKTLLPFHFSTKYLRGADDRDFTTVVFTNINTNPAPPPAASWNYQAYANVYKYLQPVIRKPMIARGGIVADFRLPLYDPKNSDSLSLSQYAGQVVLVDFWFKSCGPCMAAMPKYNALQEKYATAGFKLITINIEDPVSDMKFFYNKHNPNYPMLYNGGKVFSDLGLIGCPSSVLIGKNGKVEAVYEGFDEAVIDKRVDELVKR